MTSLRYTLGGAALLAAAVLGIALLVPSRTAARPDPVSVPSSSQTGASNAPELKPITEHVVEQQGLRVAVSLRDATSLGEAVSGRTAIATLTLTDAKSGEPVRNARPRAWMQRASDARRPPDAAACQGAIRGFMGGLLSVQADVDLNAAWLLVMNEDSTIGVLNPHVSFNRTKLRSIVSLPGRAADWVMHPNREVLFVSIPSTGEVVTVDTRRFLVAARAPVGKGANRLVLSPDGRRLFVARDGADEVVAIDYPGMRVAQPIQTGTGRLSFALADDGRELWVGAEDSSTVQVFDALSLEPLGQVDAGKGVVALSASDSGGEVVVANGRSGDLLVIDRANRTVRSRVSGQPGWTDVRFEPSGRWAFAINRDRGALSVLDASSGKERAALSDLGAPDTLTFTRGYAYVRDASHPRVWLLQLDALSRSGSPGVAEVPIGQSASGPSTTAAAAIAPTAERDGVVVASRADRALFFYREGMMAPLGSIRNSGREPRAVLLLDRSLHELEPGVYRTQAELGLSGTYDVSVLVDAPRTAACLSVPVAPSSDEKQREAGHALALEPVDAPLKLIANQRGSVRFRLRDGEQAVPASEVQVLAFRARDNWQWRGTARAEGEGVLAVDLPAFTPGEVTVVVGVPRRRAALGDLPPLRVAVRPAPARRVPVSAEVVR